jgi:Spy/CpxP family protein refolding chaperone
MRKHILTYTGIAALAAATVGYAGPSDSATTPTVKAADTSCSCDRKKYGKHHGHRGGMMGDPVAKLAIKLDLSKEQRDAIRTAFDKNKSQVEKYQDQLIDSMQQLRSIALSDNYDEKQVEKYANLQGDAISNLTQLRIQTKQAILQILTPEQQKAFKQMAEKKFGHKRGGGRGF